MVKRFLSIFVVLALVFSAFGFSALLAGVGAEGVSPASPPGEDPDPTDTPAPDPTDTPEPNPTDTPEPDPTYTPEPEPSDTPEPDPSETPEPLPSETAVPQPIETIGPIATPAPSPGTTTPPNNTPRPTQAQPTPEPTEAPTPAPVIPSIFWNRAADSIIYIRMGSEVELVLVEGIAPAVEYTGTVSEVPAGFAVGFDRGTVSLRGNADAAGTYDLALGFSVTEGGSFVLNFRLIVKEGAAQGGFPSGRYMVPFGGEKLALLPAEGRRKEDAV